MTTTDTCDYLVVGGGAAGCVVASRLAENPDVRVTLLEAGGPDRSFQLRIPALTFAPIASREFNWHFETEPVPALNDRRIKIHHGKVLGGSSSINGMQYSRGHSREYDAWRDMGCDGWGFEDVLPYFKLSEANARGPSKWHGASGPIAVRRGSPNLPICDAFLAAAAEAGFPVVDDVNQDALEAFGFSDVNIKRGRRISASYGYLHRQTRKNLTVLTRTRATRILIEGGRAIGVEFIEGDKARTIRAERETIVCAGAIKSPQLLMLSGIGPAEHLRTFGIRVAVDAPRVGANFQNHASYHMRYATAEGTTSYRYLKPARALKAGFEYLLSGTGGLGESPAGMFGVWRSDPTLDVPDSHVTILTALMSHPHSTHPKAWELLPKEDGFQCSVHFTPFSRGRVRLGSADPLAAPSIDAGYYSDARDMQLCIKGVRKLREITGAKPLRALIRRELAPGDDLQDDASIEAHIRSTCGNSYHPSGTCAMGGDGAVVDPQLRVRGVDGLRVADASIIPVIPNSGLHGPVLMIGEKAAALIAAAAAP